MNFNWGTGIAMSMGAFMIMITCFVVGAFRHNTDLVAADYYDQEIRYQERIDQMARATKADAKVGLSWQGDGVRMQLPQGVTTGNVHFFRPADAQLDFVVALSPDSAGVQEVRNAKLVSGLWRLKAEWQQGGELYYQETSMVLP